MPVIHYDGDVVNVLVDPDLDSDVVDVCPAAVAAAFGSTKTGRSGALVWLSRTLGGASGRPRGAYL
jgi:hypothetical protein